MKASNAGMDGAVMNVVFFGAMNCMGSAVVIAFNKYLLSAHRFPFVSCLVIAHCAVGWAMAAVLYLLKPSWFPSLIGEKKVNVNFELIAKGALPIAWLFAAQLVLSNMALEFCSIAFLQMMKETSVVLVYMLSVAFSMEVYDHQKGLLIIFILFATWLTIHGEIRFSLVGFLLQASCMVFQAFCVVLQGKLLASSTGQKLDPLSYVLIIMPLSGLMLIVAVGGVHYNEAAALPSLSLLQEWLPTIFLNATCAFAHNIVVCFFFKYSSALTVSLNAIMKDSFIVACSSVALQEPITLLQKLGFGLQLSAVATFSLLKLKPEEFKDGLALGLWRCLVLFIQEKWAGTMPAPVPGLTKKSLEPTSRTALAVDCAYEQAGSYHSFLPCRAQNFLVPGCP
mmetsp:Transcript_19987/g.35471  ORF Transcript_19987/g.35471 Transcript_19987/m.35471 type:complete len:395 (-) Transcript_19987:64-1248(-)